MENFFDVATKEELKEFYDDEFTLEQIKREKQQFEKWPDTNFAQLFRLYLLRGDKEKAFSYLEKISDKNYRYDMYHTFYAPLE